MSGNEYSMRVYITQQLVLELLIVNVLITGLVAAMLICCLYYISVPLLKALF